MRVPVSLILGISLLQRALIWKPSEELCSWLDIQWTRHMFPWTVKRNIGGWTFVLPASRSRAKNHLRYPNVEFQNGLKPSACTKCRLRLGLRDKICLGEIVVVGIMIHDRIESLPQNRIKEYQGAIREGVTVIHFHSSGMLHKKG